MACLNLYSSEPHLVCCVPSLRSIRNELISNRIQEKLSPFSNFSYSNMIVHVPSASFVLLTLGVIYFK